MPTPIPLELDGRLSTYPVQVLAGAQTIFAYSAGNSNQYPVYIKFYDKLSDNINVAVDVPAYKITVPAATLSGPGLATNDNTTLVFTTAISVRCTTVDQDIDTTSPAASPTLDIQLDQSSGPGGGTGNVSNTGTPTTGQIALWVNSTTVQGTTTLPDANTAALTGDVTKPAGSSTTTLATIPTGVSAVGSIIQSAIAAPSTPGAGTGAVYVDATAKTLSVKNDAGAVSHTVKTKAAVADNFVTAIADDGTVSVAQASFPGLSGSLSSSQMPALTGDVTTSAGATTTTLANIPNAAPAVGTILHSNIAAPSSPAAGKVAVFSDSTDLRLHDKNNAGTIGTTVVADTGATNNFLTAVSAAGVISKAQPAFSNLSGNIAVAQIASGTGASGTTFLRGDNTWVAPAGSGNVSNTGTPTSGQLAAFTNATTVQGVTALPATNFPALTGDVTTSAGALATTLANIPNLAPAAGALLYTNIAAPSSPAAGKAKVYVDSTSKALASKNDTGTVSHTVQTKAAVSNNFLTAIADDGTVSATQPGFSNLSGSASAAQMPAFSGDVTTSAGSTVVAVVSTGGAPFAASATTDTTDLGNIPTGNLDASRIAYTRTHVTEAATITIPLGDGIDRDSTASGTLTTIAFSGSASGVHPWEARIRLLVTGGTKTITIPASRRLGTVGTFTTVSLNNGSQELSWVSQPTGGAGALEYWMADSGDDIRQTFSNAPVTVSNGVRQLAQTGTMSAARVVTMPAASAYPNGSGFWITDESNTVDSTNKLVLTGAGGDTVNGGATRDLTTGFVNILATSDGISKWITNPTTVANISDVAFGSSWNSVIGTAPSKNAVYDQLHLFDTDDDGNVDRLGSAIIAAGASGQAPLRYTSGTVATSPTAGDTEYDGKVHYSTHATNERGVALSAQYINLSANYTLVSQTAAQQLFNTPTNGRVTLAANTAYMFRCVWAFNALSATTGTFGFALGGSATFTQAWKSQAAKGAFSNTTTEQVQWNTAANTTLTGTNTATAGIATIEGTVRVTTGGTLQPQVSITQLATPAVQAGSFFEIWPIGSDTVTSVGNWD